MKKTIMAGCDLHQETMVLKVWTGEPKTQAVVYPSDAAGRRRMFKDLKKAAEETGGAEIYLAYEASGMGFKLYDEAVKAGIRCYVLAPTKISKSVNERKTKTDHKDAQKLLEVLKGHVLAGNEIPAIWVPDEATRDDREVVRARVKAGEEAAKARVEIGSLLKRYEIKVKKDVNWEKNIQGLSRGETKESKKLGKWARIALESLLRQWRAFEGEVEKLGESLKELAQSQRYKEPVKALDGLKGVGPLTALVFLTEMGDLRRFKNRRQVGKYLGLVPSSDESGSSGERKGHITRHGSGRVRKMLCQGAWVRLRTPGGPQTTYERICQKNPKYKKIGVVALMRKLAIEMWHVGLEAQKRAGVRWEGRLAA
jgi:transposase